MERKAPQNPQTHTNPPSPLKPKPIKKKKLTLYERWGMCAAQVLLELLSAPEAGSSRNSPQAIRTDNTVVTAQKLYSSKYRLQLSSKNLQK